MCLVSVFYHNLSLDPCVVSCLITLLQVTQLLPTWMKYTDDQQNTLKRNATISKTIKVFSRLNGSFAKRSMCKSEISDQKFGNLHHWPVDRVTRPLSHIDQWLRNMTVNCITNMPFVTAYAYWKKFITISCVKCRGHRSHNCAGLSKATLKL